MSQATAGLSSLEGMIALPLTMGAFAPFSCLQGFSHPLQSNCVGTVAPILYLLVVAPPIQIAHSSESPFTHPIDSAPEALRHPISCGQTSLVIANAKVDVRTESWVRECQQLRLSYEWKLGPLIEGALICSK